MVGKYRSLSSIEELELWKRVCDRPGEYCFSSGSVTRKTNPLAPISPKLYKPTCASGSQHNSRPCWKSLTVVEPKPSESEASTKIHITTGRKMSRRLKGERENQSYLPLALGRYGYSTSCQRYRKVYLALRQDVGIFLPDLTSAESPSLRSLTLLESCLTRMVAKQESTADTRFDCEANEEILG